MDTSDVIADRLIDWGVNAIFVLPGRWYQRSRTYAGLSVTKVDLEMYCESDIIGERIIAGISGRYSREFIRDSHSHGTEALILCVGYQNIENV